uniref:Beta-lactamase-related domain-containing protein n=1 Tax=Romanomermis culicivorax TaxID=13658 RepID=A0A915IRF4_ROMCU
MWASVPSSVICLFGDTLRKILNVKKPTVEIHGFVKPGFESVKDAFRQNFDNYLEPEGATLAIYHKGELVANLWAGDANSKVNKKWAQDTLCIAFSTTKIATAMCLALLVDRGLVQYEDLVTKYWPEFGKNGKSSVTVRMLVSHQAGVAILDQDVTFDTVRDYEKMSTLLEDQTPNWTISEQKAGYHAITFGFLIDQLVRRVDPQKRSLGRFFREEIAIPYGRTHFSGKLQIVHAARVVTQRQNQTLDKGKTIVWLELLSDIEFYIGLPDEHHDRVCHLIGPNALQFVYDLSEPDFIRAIYRMCKNPTSTLLWQSLKNPKWLEVGKNGETAFNDPELYKLEIGGANGICTAKALAKLLTLFIGEKPIFSPNLMQILEKPLLTDSPDVVLGVNMNYGHGLMYFKNPNGHYKIGHTGYGGQNARLDPDYQMSIAYLHNALSSDSGAYSRTFKILENA